MSEKTEILTKRKIKARRIVQGLAKNETYETIARDVGITGKNPRTNLYQSIHSDYVQDEIKRNLAENGKWTLERSQKEALKQYENLSKSKNSAEKAIAYRYKENLDKISGLMIEKVDLTSRTDEKELIEKAENWLKTVKDEVKIDAEGVELGEPIQVNDEV